VDAISHSYHNSDADNDADFYVNSHACCYCHAIRHYPHAYGAVGNANPADVHLHSNPHDACTAYSDLDGHCNREPPSDEHVHPNGYSDRNALKE
jgi:hypothetical protein